MSEQRHSLFDRAIVATMPIIPRPIVKRVAMRYVAGATSAEALATIRELNALGARCTVDILGEEVMDRQAAEQATAEYVDLISEVASSGVDSNISLKPTQLGLKIDAAFCQQNIKAICEAAKAQNNFVRLDMEDHTCTDQTLEIYRALQPECGNLGVVLQAMLRRTPDDIASLAQGKANVRLCKGIYREPEAIAYQDRQEVQQAYVRSLNQLFDAGCYVGIATHDEVLVDAARRAISERGLSKDAYEFQMLIGVTPRLRQRLISEGHALRVYVPYGVDWYAYSIRRLRENPTVAKHIMLAMFRRG